MQHIQIDLKVYIPIFSENLNCFLQLTESKNQNWIFGVVGGKKHCGVGV